MIRKHLTLAMTLLLVLSGSATASGALRATASPQVVRDAPECGGKGFSKLVLTPGRTYGCVHTAGDLFGSRAAAQGRALGKPAAAKVPCYGNGTSGPRIQFIYGYHAGIPNRGPAVTKQVRDQMAPRMQAVINGQANGKNLGLRFAMTKGCAVDVKVIKFPRDVQYGSDDPGNPADQLVAAAKYLDKIGYNRDDRKYQILWDGWNVGACGIGFLNANPDSTLFSLPNDPFSEGLPRLGVDAEPNVAGSDLASKVSMVFNHAGGPHGGTCFSGDSLSTVTTQVHELFHTLGAVQFDAPHANTGHCDDAPSIMCPGGGVGYGLGINNPSCAKVLVETLDCGEDDYWNVNPKPGTYLSTHLNIAKSKFFGPQPQDDLINLPL